MNTSTYTLEKTAYTIDNIAEQRARNIKKIFNPRNVIELCCGKSLNILKKHYQKQGIKIYGNDIDEKYLEINPELVIGDCLKIKHNKFEVCVFAPPLSKGCSGKREDALSIEEVEPSYYDFINLNLDKFLLVLAGKTFSIRKDRNQYYKLLNYLDSKGYIVEIIPLKYKKINKYIDLYVRKK